MSKRLVVSDHAMKHVDLAQENSSFFFQYRDYVPMYSSEFEPTRFNSQMKTTDDSHQKVFSYNRTI